MSDKKTNYEQIYINLTNLTTVRYINQILKNSSLDITFPTEYATVTSILGKIQNKLNILTDEDSELIENCLQQTKNYVEPV